MPSLPHQPLKVLISGAGIAGPCLAYWLTRTPHPISITVLERSRTPRTTGQSIDIRGSAIDIVKKMGLESAIRGRHTTEEKTVFLNSSGNVFADFKAGDSFTAEFEILRGDLAGLFLEATEKLEGVEYKYGESITSVDEREDAVDVSLSDGSKGTYDLLVCADGSTSRTRGMILDEKVLQGSYNFLGQYLAYFSIPRAETDQKRWCWYNTPRGHCIMTRPHRNESTTGAYLCVTMPARGVPDPGLEEAMEEEGMEASKRVLQSYFENEGWEAQRVLAGMQSSDDFYMSRAAQVKLPKWHTRRSVLIGDAAFATFGIGTTLAIEAAYTLAGEIGKAAGSEEIPKALNEYEKVFRGVLEEMDDLPGWFPQIAFPQWKSTLRARDALLWVMSRTGLYKYILGEDDKDGKVPEYEWSKR